MFDDDFFISFDAFADAEPVSGYWLDNTGGEKDETRAQPTARALRRQARHRLKRQKYNATLKELIAAPPKPGESIHVVGANQFQFYTWIPTLVDWLDYVDEFYCATWTANANSARDFFRLMDAGKIRGEVGYMFGTYFKRREPVVYAQYAEQLHTRGGWIKSFETHAKIMLLSNEKRGDYMTVEGSGNLTHNPRFEQYTITNDAELWNFHRAWVQEVKELKKNLWW